MTALRTLILAAYPTLRFGLQAALDIGDEFEIAGVVAGFQELSEAVDDLLPDIILADIAWTVDDLDDIGGLLDLPPVLLLVESPAAAADAITSGFRGVLLRDATADEIIAALRALANGLAVLDPRAIRELSGHPPAREMDLVEGIEPLTSRESQVLELIAAGFTNKGIAIELGISEHTVKFHVGSILSKLDASSRSEAIARAIHAGMLTV